MFQRYRKHPKEKRTYFFHRTGRQNTFCIAVQQDEQRNMW